MQHISTSFALLIESVFIGFILAGVVMTLVAGVYCLWCSISDNTHKTLNDNTAYESKTKKWNSARLLRITTIVFLVVCLLYVALCTIKAVGIDSFYGGVLYACFPLLTVLMTTFQSLNTFLPIACILIVLFVLALRTEKITDYELSLYEGFHPVISAKHYNVKPKRTIRTTY